MDSTNHENLPPQPPRWQKILFPVSKATQLQAALISIPIIVVGSLLGNLAGVWNLNLLAPLVVGFFFGIRIHPVVGVGPAAVALSILGISWTLAFIFGIAGDLQTTTAMLQGSVNIFLAMTAGTVAQLVYKKFSRHDSSDADETEQSPTN